MERRSDLSGTNSDRESQRHYSESSQRENPRPERKDSGRTGNGGFGGDRSGKAAGRRKSGITEADRAASGDG